jgi:hypothetical protein
MAMKAIRAVKSFNCSPEASLIVFESTQDSEDSGLRADMNLDEF